MLNKINTKIIFITLILTILILFLIYLISNFYEKFAITSPAVSPSPSNSPSPSPTIPIITTLILNPKQNNYTSTSNQDEPLPNCDMSGMCISSLTFSSQRI